MIRKMAVLGVAYMLLASTVAFAAPRTLNEGGDEVTLTQVSTPQYVLVLGQQSSFTDKDGRDGIGEQ